MNDIASELAKLHHLTGAEFSRQVECIAHRSEFHPLEGETAIFTAGGESEVVNYWSKAVKASHR
jgi:hypothetical protein